MAFLDSFALYIHHKPSDEMYKKLQNMQVHEEVLLRQIEHNIAFSDIQCTYIVLYLCVYSGRVNTG